MSLSHNGCYPLRVGSYVKLNFLSKIFLLSVVFVGCTSTFLKLEKKEEDFKKNTEFEEKVVIKEISADDLSKTQESVSVPANSSINSAQSIPDKKNATNGDSNFSKEPVGSVLVPERSKSQKKKKNKDKLKSSVKESDSKKSQDVSTVGDTSLASQVDSIEDREGIQGRRPVKDPFRVGEEVIHDVHYFKVSAGELRLKVGSYAEVNGRKSYKFTTELESSRMFSTFYSVEDSSTTYVDFFDLVPHVFSLSVKETGQIRDAKGLFDITNGKATYWEKKFTKKNGQEEMKKEWEIPSFSQNVYSAAYYMRIFKWDVGKEYSFRVADAGENIVFSGKAIRKERLDTEVGEFDAIVVKPEITVKGIFKPIGDIYFWLSDDDRKFILRIESSIKIGTIVSEVTKLKTGNP